MFPRNALECELEPTREAAPAWSMISAEIVFSVYLVNTLIN